jgi:hypothetical protein
MNWFTRKYIASAKPEEKEKYFNSQDFGGCCEHCEADHALAAVVSYENDSFGRESYIACQACAGKADDEADREEVVCYDCHARVQRKDSISWRWYDFYAAQGDTPLIICSSCVKKEKHQDRVKRDRQDAQAEEEYYTRYR